MDEVMEESIPSMIIKKPTEDNLSSLLFDDPLASCLLEMYENCGFDNEGSMSENLYLENLRLTSVTFATAIINLTPVVIFILAKILGKESLKLRTSAGKLKIIGIILSPVGVALLTFCHLMEINIESIKFDLLSHVKHETEENHNLVLGLGLAIMATLCNAIFFILQDFESFSSPDPISTSLVGYMNPLGPLKHRRGSYFFFFGYYIYALCVEKDWAQWKLGWDIRLWAATFCVTIRDGCTCGEYFGEGETVGRGEELFTCVGVGDEASLERVEVEIFSCECELGRENGEAEHEDERVEEFGGGV
ncbi:WAT1-related protein At1g25270-like [Cornus florida]|uniref:WAT1-related protein At1g25270-like n=1 Tax=Cornus florida TaxID=4283 RepID=UPI0028993CEA|nr:WAT1-related protein At1g25270-like [Cornus florida]